MREYVRTKNLREGDVTSETLYNEKMQVLLRAGNKLNIRAIETIRKLGYKGIYIENQESCRREEIPLPQPLLNNEMMLRMAARLKKMVERASVDGSQISGFIHMLEDDVEDIVAIIRDRANRQELLYEMYDMRMASNWLYYHSIATCILSAGIAVMLGFTDEKVRSIALGGMLHDIGKVFLGDDLYEKTDITEDERQHLREHPEQMFRLLQRVTTLPIDTTYAVWQHHEKCDGSGYPLGIAKDKIYMSAQIVALANVYDNMTNITPYQDPMTGAEAYEYLAGCGQYSVECVQALRSFASIYNVGTKVLLSDGRIAVVLKNVPGIPERPYLLCEGKVLRMAYDYQLMALVIADEIS
ncbi:MAG: HD domain-containing protein [Lachnospiraceae bacterium]|nr:HD domain-containing protein [Lachnospiraceae bacterium]